ncbi:hypothetical protein AB1N83_001846 [Pleurotus pulmonarius]|nr:hypothetical protein EYR36_004861 [Pleurotus pulmonarius]KAF4578713.1 hypothetical protein EYR36_000520 [Pleurotus pulmonarius]
MEAPLNNTKFNLDVSGIVGFLGGGEAISAMESMHFNKYRKWLGWYNSPGSYDIAKHYGRLARSRIWDGIYPGPNDEPAKLLGMDEEKGPRYRGIVSGTTLNNTGHVGHIFAQYCHDLKATVSQYSSDPVFSNQRQTTLIIDDKRTSTTESVEMNQSLMKNDAVELSNTPVPGRKTKVMNVVVVDFEENSDNGGALVGEADTLLQLAHTESPLWSVAIASVPIFLNLVCCILSGLYDEWFAFGVILYGILCNGIACYFIGSAKIYLRHTIPSPHSPPGNGILEHESDTLIVCRGSEKAVNRVKGKFIVRYGKDGKDKTYHKIGFSAISLTTQFIAQLFLIPLSGLFGQIMFLSTLAISWIYNAYLSSIDKGQLQQHLLMKNLHTTVKKLELPTRTSAVVFAMLCGLPGEDPGKPASIKKRAEGIMSHMLPTGTEVWDKWRTLVSDRVHTLSDIKKDRAEPPPTLFDFAESELQEFDGGNKNLLKDLLDDARGGYKSYLFLKSVGAAPNPNTHSNSPA